MDYHVRYSYVHFVSIFDICALEVDDSLSENVFHLVQVLIGSNFDQSIVNLLEVYFVEHLLGC